MSLSGLLSGCPGGDDLPPLFLDTQWQVRCDIQGGCVLPPVRNVFGVDGDDGVGLFCSAVPSGDNVILTMRANRNDGAFGIQFQSVVIPRAGGDIGGVGCQVVVDEGPNTYRGSCGPAAVSGGCLEDPEVSSNSCDQACRLFNVAISENNVISGQLYCQGLALSADPKRVVELTNANVAGSGRDAASFPISFIIEACEGL